jgi:hypothetical protein
MPLTIEEFATARARIDAGHRREEILADLGADPVRWADDEVRLLGELADEAEAGALDRIRAYQRAYDSHRAELRRGRPPSADALGNAPTAEVLRTDPDRAPPPNAPALLAATFQKAGATAQPASTPRPASSASAPAVGTETAAIDVQKLRAALLPFAKDAAVAVPPASTAPKSAPAHADTGTAEADASKLRKPGTPFEDPFSATAAIDMSQLRAQLLPFLAQGGRASPATHEGRTPPPHIDTGTEEIDTAAVRAAMAAHGIALPAATAADAPTEHRPLAGRPMPPTVLLPDAPAPSLAEPAMPLERYAAISAMLAKEGDPPSTFRRLGLDPVAWMSTVRAYSQRFASDPTLQQQFDLMMKKALGHAR